MATIKLGSTKAMNALITYAENEEKAEKKSGLNCDVDYVKEQMKTTRLLFGKDNGRQGYHVIQSFDPEDGVTPEQANDIGRALAAQVAPGHEVAIFTHTDQNHLHNHICINSVNMETGKKFVNDRQKLYEIRTQSDALCQQYELSIVKEKTADIRYTQAEQNIMDQTNNAKSSWKNQVRMAIEETKNHATNFDEFNELLKPQGVEIARTTEKTITYKHIEEDKKVRGNKLGHAYDKEEIINAFGTEKRRREHERDQKETQPDRNATQADWRRFEARTQQLEQQQRAQERAEAARLADEKSREIREQRERAEQQKREAKERTRGFDLDL
ncbi:DNA polymerase III alpha subunit (gram-positive type) [Staphylococcus saprophyticus]|nr:MULTISPECIES: relaxase/mobilization nuclease domain-containing protein [Staphylococcus]MBN6851829.1 relaxase/mobilization nuclease domain-containing protein [Staphylococcus saprophyticus]MDW3933412.1 relaxase/mobilization nuclease domain-containing protein [Staphylococcus saprophyticus]MDW3958658.1 relaxase/mobilization nuclease domain-containing protein [Staphylococcus saprophyticus]MDW4001119.1 relaxase/mobilization nuclease domain-containing protein [Staphylococcus saprophyticus]MDW40462